MIIRKYKLNTSLLASQTGFSCDQTNGRATARVGKNCIQGQGRVG